MVDTPSGQSPPSSSFDTVRYRTAARLAAVQALYQIEMSAASVEQVLSDCLRHHLSLRALCDNLDDEGETAVDLVAPDAALLTALVQGSVARQDDIDRMIAESLSPGWRPERLEAVVRAILRVGVCELIERLDVPPRVTISEFVDIARAFYDSPEPGLINAVLDRLARILRPDEFQGRKDNDKTR